MKKFHRWALIAKALYTKKSDRIRYIELKMCISIK